MNDQSRNALFSAIQLLLDDLAKRDPSTADAVRDVKDRMNYAKDGDW